MLEGAFNFRDLGGLSTRDGRRLRSRRLFRSDTLQALTPADVARLRRDLGLRGVVDLRLPEEVEDQGRGPLAAHAEIRYANLSLQMAATEGVAPEEVMQRLYLGCLLPGSALGPAVQQVCDFSDQPLVFHCAAGKDRTGLLAAVVLRLLDVDDQLILDDYMRSAAAMSRMIERFATWPRYRDHMSKAPPHVYRVEAEPLLAFLRHLDGMPGGTRGWVRAQGVRDSSLRLLSERMVEGRD